MPAAKAASARVAQRAAQGLHRQIVAEKQAVEADLIADEADDPWGQRARPLRVERRDKRRAPSSPLADRHSP